jgi:hypothetical protein
MTGCIYHSTRSYPLGGGCYPHIRPRPHLTPIPAHTLNDRVLRGSREGGSDLWPSAFLCRLLTKSDSIHCHRSEVGRGIRETCTADFLQTTEIIAHGSTGGSASTQFSQLFRPSRSIYARYPTTHRRSLAAPVATRTGRPGGLVCTQALARWRPRQPHRRRTGGCRH